MMASMSVEARAHPVRLNLKRPKQEASNPFSLAVAGRGGFSAWQP